MRSSESENLNVAVVVPTIRENSMRQFLQAWGNEFATATIIVVEDNPIPSFDLGDYPNIEHFAWNNIDADLGENAWIIPRRSDCVRSYGYLKALQVSPDVVITLDDDCYPDGSAHGFLEAHASKLRGMSCHDAWVSTGIGQVPRGVPYFSRQRRQRCVINHGLWSGVPDFDAPTQLVTSRAAGLFEPVDQAIPTGSYFPMCGMNLAFLPEMVPCMYFMLMGRNWEFDRFGDIWCGIFAKKICDHLGYGVSSGSPIVAHQRASNIWDNLRKEAPGLVLNESLWEAVDRIVLSSGTVSSCYREIAGGLPIEGDYWDSLRRAMFIWTDLVDERLTAWRSNSGSHSVSESPVTAKY